MNDRFWFAWALGGLLALSYCQCQPAAEVFPCNGTADCPNNLVCSNGLCREPFDAGPIADASTDGASDAVAVDHWRTDSMARDLAVGDGTGRDQVAADRVVTADAAGTDRSFDAATAIDVAPGNDATPHDDAAPPVDAATASDASTASDVATSSDAATVSDAAQAHWWDRSWGWRQRLTIDNSAQPEDLHDFTVLVYLDRSRYAWGEGLLDGGDVRFVASDDTTLLAHEIEQWTPTGTADGIAWIWVRVPKIDAGSSGTFIWMYYGNPNPPAPPSTYDAWAPRYRAVWHLNGHSRDSTNHSNDGTDHLVGGASGKIGGGYDFNGRDSYVAVATDVSLNNIFDTVAGELNGGTVMAWINPRSAGEGGYGRILNKAQGHLTNNGWTFEMRNSGACGISVGFERACNVQKGDWCARAGLGGYDQWHLVAAYYNDSSPAVGPLFWVDDQLSFADALTTASGQTLLDDGNNLHIGSVANSTDYTFDGVIDEVRLVDGALAPAWLAAEYLNMTDAFISYGTAERRP